MRFPLNRKIKVGYSFGQKTSYNNFHLGQDYRAYNGETLYAPSNGQIIWQGHGKQGGYTIHFKDLRGNTWRFMHLKKFLRKLGNVKEGEAIAQCDNTGLSTGSHLHLDISKGSVNLKNRSNFIDPEIYLKYNLPIKENKLKKEHFGKILKFDGKHSRLWIHLKSFDVWQKIFGGKINEKWVHPNDLNKKKNKEISKLKKNHSKDLEALVKCYQPKLKEYKDIIGEQKKQFAELEEKYDRCFKALNIKKEKPIPDLPKKSFWQKLWNWLTKERK